MPKIRKIIIRSCKIEYNILFANHEFDLNVNQKYKWCLGGGHSYRYAVVAKIKRLYKFGQPKPLVKEINQLKKVIDFVCPNFWKILRQG